MSYSLLFLARMPGLTGDMLIEEGLNEGFLLYNQFSSTGEESLKAVQERCRVRLNLRPDWSDALYFDTIAPLLPAWRKARDESPYRKKQKVETDKPQPKKSKAKQVVHNEDQGGLW